MNSVISTSLSEARIVFERSTARLMSIAGETGYDYKYIVMPLRI